MGRITFGISKVIHGDSLEVLEQFEDNYFDSVVTDGPYGLGFMNKEWDKFSAKEYQEFSFQWGSKVRRVLKPGSWVASFSAPRKYHRMVCGLEDAGFVIKDMINWCYGCLSEDTEILTLKGWKGMNEITINNKVFSFNYETNQNNQMLISNINHIFKYPYNGEMIHLKNDNTDQLLTPNHKVLCKIKSRKQKKAKREYYYKNISWRYIDAGLIIKGDQIKLPLGLNYNGTKKETPLFWELVGLILTDGWFQGSAINISQVKNRIVKRIRYILGKLQIDYSEYKKERASNFSDHFIEYQFYIKKSELTKKIQKLIPNKKPTLELLHLSLKEKEGLFKGLMEGDGGIKKTDFYQSDIKTLEWFQILCHFIGKQARINTNKMCVSIHNNPTTELQGKHMKWLLQKYNGLVWCIETTHGNFFARRNGKMFITGNSGFPKSLDISKAIDKKPMADRVFEFKKWLSKELDKCDKTSKEINNECGFTATSYKRYDAGDGWASNLPSKYKWRVMKEVIDLSDEWDWIIEDNVDERGFIKTTGSFHKGSGNTIKFKKKGKQLADNPISEAAQKWDGYGTGLKPAHEPIVLAQKPLEGTYAENVLKYGVGGLNIDASRIQFTPLKENDSRIGTNEEWHGRREASEHTVSFPAIKGMRMYKHKGRWPSNFILTHHPECKIIGVKKIGQGKQKHNSEIKRKGFSGNGPYNDLSCGFDVNKCQDLGNYGEEIKEKWECHPECPIQMLDEQSGDCPGGASRFFYCAKAFKTERNAGLDSIEETPNTEMVNRKENSAGIKNARAGAGRGQGARNTIATLKPINLMRYLVRLITSPNGIVLDLFAGSGTTGIACIIEGFNYVLIEKRKRFAEIIIPKRLEYWKNPENWDLLKDHPLLPQIDIKMKQNLNKTIDSYF